MDLRRIDVFILRIIGSVVKWTGSFQNVEKSVGSHKYYYFEAIDKPLTDKQQEELRGFSSRARINSRRFENEYNWGDFGADTEKLLKKYFDVHLHYASYGTRIIMFKIPAITVDFSLLKQYDNGATVSVAKSGSHVIVDITADSDDSEEWWEESPKINKYVSFRDDLMSGDCRCLYIAWLAGDYEHSRKRKTSPPIPPGIKKLSGTLRSFVDFMYLDEERLQKALELADNEEPPAPTTKDIKDWVANLPDKDCQKVLVDLLQDKVAAQIIQRELKNRFLKDYKTEPSKVSCLKKPSKKLSKK